MIEIGGGTVAVFGSLPEQTRVVAQKWRELHLRAVAQDGVAFAPEFLRRQRHSHLNVFNVPFSPGTAIHPYAAVGKPRGTLLSGFIDSGKHCVGAFAMRAVRIGQISRNVYLMRFHTVEK